MANRHFLLVTFPAQGHINPALQFAKRLVSLGARVTFATTLAAHRRMSKHLLLPQGISLATFSDGHDDGHRPGTKDSKAAQHYMLELKRRGSQALSDLIVKNEKEGCPFRCVFYTLLLPWAAEVAGAHQIPSALVWIQPATVFDIYYYYFNGYRDLIREKSANTSSLIELPGLPTLTARDLPSFLLASQMDMYAFALPSFEEQMDILKSQKNATILVNTFDALEANALKAVEEFKLMGIGPLIPSAFLDGKDPTDTSFGGDLLEESNGYMEWLDSKPRASVIYVSFGTIVELSKRQMAEIGHGLLETGRPFLWVIRGGDNKEEEKNDKLSCTEELEKQGMVVPWCSQVQVLSHPSMGCFVTHCGWNSTFESLVSGIPVVAFPQWTDQGTNAKLVEDVWKTGVRVSPNEEGIVESGEIKRCLELVMQSGETSEELRRNVKKWRDLSREAVTEGGSSMKNLKDFLDEVGDVCDAE